MRSQQTSLGGRLPTLALALSAMLLFGLPAGVAVGAPQTFTGSVNAAGASWATHTFQVSGPGTITATLSWTGSANLNLGLRDPTGAWVEWASSPTANPEQIVHTTVVAGGWTLGVKAKTGSADYSLEVDPGSDPPPPDDLFQGTVDAAGSSWATHVISVGGPGTISAVLSWPGSADLNLGLRDPSGQWVRWSASSSSNPEQIVHEADVPGNWTLGVSARSGSAAYELSVTYPNSGGGGGPTTPIYLSTIGGPGHADMYPSGLDIGVDGTVYVADTGNDGVSAYGPAGNLLWSVSPRAGRVAGSFSNPRDVAVAGSRLFVGDTGYNRVQVLDPSDGSTLAVWGTHIPALMGLSTGVDATGTTVVLVTDGTTSTVKVFSVNGALIRTVGGGPGTGDGQLNEPRDAATDADGNIYVADFRNHRVARFSPTGAWLGSYGELGNGPGQFNAPYGIDLDDAGNIYVADSNNGRVQALSPAGQFVAQWGSDGPGPDEFFQLRRVAVSSGPSPDVLGADLWGLKILRYANDGSLLETLGGGPPADGGFNEPYGVTHDASRVYVTDTTNQRVQRFGSDGSWQLTWGVRGWGEDLSGLNWPRDVAYMAANDRVWVSDTKNNRVTEYATDGTPTGRTLGLPGTGQGQLKWPHAVEVVGDDLIIADTYNHRVLRWDPDAGPGNAEVWTARGFNYPKDVAVHGGTVFVADALNGSVARLDASTGALLGVIGAAVLHQPEGVAVTPSGNIWVADTPWNRIVELAPDGTTRQVFGSRGSSHGRFDRPEHLDIRVVGDQTRLYVVDQWNDRVEVFIIGS